MKKKECVTFHARVFSIQSVDSRLRHRNSSLSSGPFPRARPENQSRGPKCRFSSRLARTGLPMPRSDPQCSECWSALSVRQPRCAIAPECPLRKSHSRQCMRRGQQTFANSSLSATGQLAGTSNQEHSKSAKVQLAASHRHKPSLPELRWKLSGQAESNCTQKEA